MLSHNQLSGLQSTWADTPVFSAFLLVVSFLLSLVVVALCRRLLIVAFSCSMPSCL